MFRFRVQDLKPFLVTTLVILGTGYLKLFLNDIFNIDSPILLFLSAIGLCAWYGGTAQGIFAVGISTTFIYNYFVMRGDISLVSDGVWNLRMILYLVDAFIIATVCGELYKSRNKLTMSEVRLRRLFDANMIGLVVSDSSGKVLQANDYYLNLLGVTREFMESGKLNWRDYTAPDSFERSNEGARKLQEDHYFAPFEKEYIRKDGTRVPVLLGGAQMDARTMIGFAMDLSQSKMAERLMQSESFLESVVEFIPNMIFVKDAANLRFVRFNRAGEELLGLPRAELIGKSDYDFLEKDKAEASINNDRQILNNGVVVDIPEEPISTPHGTRYLHTKKIPLVDKNGVPQYLLAVSEDISEKKVAERQQIELMQAQVARSEAEKSSARLSFLSEASARLNETLDSQAMLKSFALLMTEQFSSRCVIEVVDESMSSEVMRTEAWNTSGHRGVESSVRPQLDQPPASNGQSMTVPLRGYGKNLGNITFFAPDGAIAYDALDLSIAGDLARRAALAIENARLFAQAKEANRAKSAFLANVSHELRTPLGAMLGFAELAMESKSTDSIAQYVKTILRNGKELLRIVDEVLDLSKAESNSMEIESIRFSLPDLLNDISTLLQVRTAQKNLELRFVNRGDLPEYVYSDPFRLRQILLNIVGNAIKFTDQGSITVESSFQDGTLQFLISDTGIGINPTQRERLFSPFTQADDSTSRKFGGTGLGLFLSRKLAALMGGDVRLLQSTPKKGSQFLVTVQVSVDDSADRTQGKHEVIKPDEGPPHDMSDSKILVVDDSPDNQDLIAAFLAKSGIKSDTALMGSQAVTMANDSYDAILMDIQMPGMDGFEALRRVREKGLNIPVIAVTAHAMKGDRERCLSSGFNDYLCKPLSRKALEDCLKRHL